MDDAAGNEAAADGSSTSEGSPAIRLDDVLKLAGIVTTGGQAKHLIQSGQVMVNGSVETRRKHLLQEGDEVAVGGEVFVVELAEGDAPEDDAAEAAPAEDDAADDANRS